MIEEDEVVWKPLLGSQGVLHGIALSSVFAQKCLAVEQSPEEYKRMHSGLWRRAQPSDWDGKYEPDLVFDTYENTLLLKAVYMRHSGSGKWLDAELLKIRHIDDKTETALTYSYHHAGWHDMDYNVWLQFAFDMWSKYAVYRMKEGV